MRYQLNKTLIEEGFKEILKRAGKKILSFLNIGTVPVKELDKIVTRAKKSKNILEETTLPKNNKLVGGTVNMTDTCFTTIMKMINREDLITRYRASASIFLKAYTKLDKPIKIDKNNIKTLKKGHVILNWWEPDNDKTQGVKLNNTYDTKLGIMQTGPIVETVAHFAIIVDPKKRIMLHNSAKSFDEKGPTGVGSKLELLLQSYKEEGFIKNSYVLDANIIKKM